MKNPMFFAMMMVISLMLAHTAAKAQGQIEVTCRAKAKEIALETYQGCVTEARTSQLKEIRDGYKSEMAAVKTKYDQKLKELNGTVPSAKKASKPEKGIEKATAPAVATPVSKRKPGRPEVPVAGVAQKLPAKQNDNGPALPVQTIQDSQPVIAAPSEEEISSSEIVEVSDAAASGSDANTAPAPEVSDFQ